MNCTGKNLKKRPSGASSASSTNKQPTISLGNKGKNRERGWQDAIPPPLLPSIPTDLKHAKPQISPVSTWTHSRMFLEKLAE